jgi:hypothetical protein
MGTFWTDRPKSSGAQIASTFIAAIGLGGIAVQINSAQNQIASGQRQAAMAAEQLRLSQEAAEKQIKSAQHDARENSSKQIYITYMKAGFDFPRFLDPDYATIKANREEFLLYKWFVSNMLFAYDEILDSIDLPEWQISFRYDLKFHTKYLCEQVPENPDLLGQYYQKTRDSVREAMKASSEPECLRFK